MAAAGPRSHDRFGPNLEQVRLVIEEAIDTVEPVKLALYPG